MTDAVNPESPVSELQRKLGRNLLCFQEIETGLKLVMPYIHPDAHEGGLASFKAVRAEVSDKTLGVVIEKFRESLTISSPDVLTDELTRVLKERNQLVHEFFRLPGIDFLTLDGVKAGIQYLDRQFETIQPIRGLVRSQAAATLLTIIRSQEDENSELAQHYEALLQAVGPDVEIINVNNPAMTIWETTRVVRLLKLAEERTEPFDGMTLLSRAGTLIQREEPDVSPKTYGLRRLMDVLLACGLFEVDLRPSNDSGSFVVLYRSRDRVDSSSTAGADSQS